MEDRKATGWQAGRRGLCGKEENKNQGRDAL